MISLAGLAFAVGMVVEGAIVVSGNILRLKEGGMTPLEAAKTARSRSSGADRLDDHDDRGVPAGRVPARRRRPDLRRPRADDLDCGRALDHRRDHGAAGRGRRLAQGEEAQVRLRRRLAGADGTIMRWTDTRPKQTRLGRSPCSCCRCCCRCTSCRSLDYLPPVKRAAIDAYFNFPPGMSPEKCQRGDRAEDSSRA